MNTRQKILRLFVILFLFLFAISCKKDSDNPVDPLESQPGVKTTGKIEFHSNISTSGYKIYAGMNEGKITGSDYHVKLNENAVQLISVVDNNNNPVLLSVNLTQTQEATKNINARTTAEALVYMNPLICTSSLTDASTVINVISSFNSFNSLVSYIEGQLQTSTFRITDQNTQLNSKLQNVYDDIVKYLEANKSYKVGQLNKVLDFKPNPTYQINGLSVSEYSSTSSQLTFKIGNIAKRWIDIYIDKSKDGITYEYANISSDLVPSPDIDIFSMIRQSTFFPLSYSRPLSVSTTSYKYISAKCYGLGVGRVSSQSDRDFYRFLSPAIMTGVFDLVVPVFEVITGIKNISQDLRGAPSQHPFQRLFAKVLEDVKNDPNTLTTFYKWMREGDLVKILVDVANKAIKVSANNPELIAEILGQIIGKSVLRVIVDNWLWPIRVVGAAFTAYNLGAAIGSVLSTEAVTEFVFADNQPQLPIKVEGIIREYETGNPVKDVQIKVMDSNQNTTSNIKSDSQGKYLFYTNPGTINLRINLTGYKPVNQTFNISQDILNQTDKLFSAPTIWLSKFSSSYGSVSGTVRDATNLNPVPNADIILRYGVNNETSDIISSVKSGTNGTYQFLNVPSGTYSAYYSKQGYISDSRTVSVIGDKTVAGFDINLSPDIRTTSGYRIILTWGVNPRDIDSHLFTPSIYGYKYHIYWNNKGSLTSVPYANLDVDERYSYGPETITILQSFSGTYYYSVHHYEGVGSLTTSNAIVNLYGVNGFIRSWSVPVSGSGVWWNVFAINGNTGQITNINQITSNSPSYYFTIPVNEDHLKNKK